MISDSLPQNTIIPVWLRIRMLEMCIERIHTRQNCRLFMTDYGRVATVAKCWGLLVVKVQRDITLQAETLASKACVFSDVKL